MFDLNKLVIDDDVLGLKVKKTKSGLIYYTVEYAFCTKKIIYSIKRKECTNQKTYLNCQEFIKVSWKKELEKKIVSYEHGCFILKNKYTFKWKRVNLK